MSAQDCDHAGYSHKKGRLYCRSFNYQEARERVAAGEKMTALAREYGVDVKSVRRAVDPEFRAKFDAEATAWLMSGVCPVCGKKGTTRRTKGADMRCRECAAAAIRTSVRVNGSGEVISIRCTTCKEWKAADEFSPSRRKLVVGNRGARTCRACEAKLRQAYRDRHKVPCSRCGKPCLPASERAPGARNKGVGYTDLCTTCWHAARGFGARA